MRIKQLQKEAYIVAQDHGFFSQGRWYEHNKKGKPIGEAFELADSILRTLSYAEYMGYDMERIIKEKHEYNKGRPYLHRSTKCKNSKDFQ